MLIRAINKIKEDIKVIYEKDPAANNIAEVIFCYPGFQALLMHRIAHKLAYWKVPFLPRFISYWTRIFTGIEIHPGATIGKGFFIDHGMGVVIGETAIIGDDCVMYQGVVLGGTGKEKGKRHPTIGNNVMISSGAKILGPFKVGDNSRIAAGAVVLHDIPANSTAVGVPAKVVVRKGVRVTSDVDLDQVHIPDPVSQELCNVTRRMLALEKKVAALESKGDDCE